MGEGIAGRGKSGSGGDDDNDEVKDRYDDDGNSP